MAKKLAFDRALFSAVVILTALGLAMVYSASAVVGRAETGGNPFLVKQSWAVALGLAFMAGAMHLDYRMLGRPLVVYGLLGGCLLLLVAVLFGPEINGSRRWLFVAGVSVQPSELAKLALVPYLAYQVARKQAREGERDLLLPCAFVTGLVTVLVLIEPDLGTAVVLSGTAAIVLFLAGLRWRYLGAAAAVLAAGAWFAILAVDYRRERFFAFLDPERDPLGTAYQANQSLIAVATGGVFGRGLGESLQKLHFLPHPHSDFIFSIVAEELGFVGSLALLGLFGALLWRGYRAGLLSPDPFGRYLAWGLSTVLVLQALIHVSVAVVLCPTTGIPLPFISYGGSSMVVSLTACGLLLNVSQHG